MKLIVFLVPVLLAGWQGSGRLSYPPAPKTNQVDRMHGITISDPYRTLESADAAGTRRWVEQENRLTAAYLGRTPGRDSIKKQLTEVWNAESFSGFYRAGQHYFYSRNAGLQNQPVLYVTEELRGEGRTLIDPNTLREDGTAALTGQSASWKGELMAYSVAQAGSDWQEWRVRSVKTGMDLPDVIRWTKAGGVSWTPDDNGFYYTRYPEPPPGKLLTAAALNAKIYFHRLGDPQAADKLIYERPDHPDWHIYAFLTEEGQYLFFDLGSTASGAANALAYLETNKPGARPVELIPTEKFQYTPLETIGSVVYVLTNEAAPRRRIVSFDLALGPKPVWKEVTPEATDTLEYAQIADGKILLSYTKDAHSAARLQRIGETGSRAVDMPGLGTANWQPVRKKDREMFYSYQSFASPEAFFRLDLGTGKSETVRRGRLSVDTSGFETKQVFYTSKDGTRVPMFVTALKGLVLDGSTPALLTAYGGFDISITPFYSPALVEWLRMGGIAASANIRGGGEYGEAWHKAGMRGNKQNVFDDFVAAAQWLIDNRYTSTPKLAVLGGSNGGLLIGAVLNQRPDLFGAAMPAVGVMDMLRFHKFGFGQAWTDEYGSPEDKDAFPVLLKYSPLHNIKKGTIYPPTLITTADHDDRVMPGHSLKYAATLQQAQEGPAPILLRVETRAGHGAGKPTAKQIDEWTDRFVFLKGALKMRD